MLERREPPSLPVRARVRGENAGDVMLDGVASVAANFVFLQGVHAQPGKVKASVQQEGTGARGRVTAVSEDGIHVSGFGAAEFDTTGMVLIDDEPAGVPSDVSRVPPVPCMPSARYLDLMLEGARAVGMNEAELAELAATPCTPRKSEKELNRLPVDSTVAKRHFTRADVESDDSLRIIRGMVFELPQRQPNFGRAGADLALMAASQMRDPLYGSPPSDPMEAWDGWGFVEDMLCSFMPAGLKHVGWIQSDDHA